MVRATLKKGITMSLHLETLKRSTVAYLGAILCTVMLVVASTPHVPLV